MDEKVNSLYNNYTLNLVNFLVNIFILGKKQVYKLKYNIKKLISRYKTCWVVKNFQE